MNTLPNNKWRVDTSAEIARKALGFPDFNSEVLKNGLVGEIDDVKIYRENKPLFKKKLPT